MSTVTWTHETVQKAAEGFKLTAMLSVLNKETGKKQQSKRTARVLTIEEVNKAIAELVKAEATLSEIIITRAK
jgi:hypothetical protein